jgi:NAD(P)-dependent dehydrogenase (short-subunit alcohol dehydrogenase family)
MPSVLITGANGNLGTAVTRSFLEKGYSVIATVHNEASKGDLAANANLRTEVIDLRDEAATGSFVSQIIQDYQTIDAAVLLVGGFAMGNLQATGTDAIRNQISLNFETAYHVVRPLFYHMLERNEGKIVLVGARPALQPAAGKNMIAYSLSKSLLFRLAEYLNAEAKGKNVTVTVLVPSTIDTKPNRESMPDADPDNWVKPEEIASVIHFVVSDKALRESVLKVYKNA